MELKNKKVLLMGLGILGGGVATARWLVEQGAILTVTDMKDAVSLEPSLDKLKDLEDRTQFVLGKHREEDFLNNDIIVLNQDIPFDNKFVEIARKAGKKIENELTLFFAFSKSKEIIAITGTRGKTTTANWTTHFLRDHNPDTLLCGNNPDKPLLQEIKNINASSVLVLEVPSYNLEIIDDKNFRPHIAVITSLYRDHLNRHKTMENYARTKANIFSGQIAEDFLILDRTSEWTDFFLGLKPKSKVLFCDEQDIFSEKEKTDFVKEWGIHNFKNLLAAATTALAAGVPVETIKKSVADLPQIKFRQEKIFDDGKIAIYNDTAATSPEASIAALERFAESDRDLVFIVGGTDRDLEYGKWAETVKKYLEPRQLVLLSGSATEKMKRELSWESYIEFDTLRECLEESLRLAQSDQNDVVFSPGAKSFEKFKNEFDRGEQFNQLAKSLLK